MPVRCSCSKKKVNLTVVWSTPFPHPPIPKKHTLETQKDRDVMGTLTDGATVLWRRLGEGQPFQTEVTTRTRPGIRAPDCVGSHHEQLDVKLEAGSGEMLGRKGTRGQL